jgi:hypothetical protein
MRYLVIGYCIKGGFICILFFICKRVFYSMNQRKLVFLCVVLTSLASGCTVFEFVAQPFARQSLSVSSSISTPQVFTCVERSIYQLSTQRGTWNTKVTRRDEALGILETGNYSDPNIIDFRLRATHRPAQGQLLLELKGGGPYYVDLGVDAGVQSLKAGVQDCLHQG